MANGPEQGGNPESPTQRKIREARENIKKVVGGIDNDATKSEEEKKKEKSAILRASREELNRHLEKHENVPEDRRDPDKAAEDVMAHVAELAELVEQKVVPHLPEIAGAVVTALATKKFSPRKALLIGRIVSEIVGSEEFKATTEAGKEAVKKKLRDLSESLRGGGQDDVADVVAEQLGPPEPPKPPEKPPNQPGLPEYGEDPGDDHEPIEKYLNKHYRRIKATRDPSTGAVVEGNSDWLDIEERKANGGGYMGMTAEHQKSLLGVAIVNQIDLTRSQRVVIRAFDGGDEFKAYFMATKEMLTEKLRAEGTLQPNEEADINKVYKEMSGHVKELVRELLSSLSGTVDQANAKESRYIGLLVDRISRNIRTEITGDVDMDVPGSIKLEGADAFLPSEGPTGTNRKIDSEDDWGNLVGGMGEYLVPRNVQVSLSEALVDDLAATLTKLQKITVGFHNARTNAYSLGSHKELGEQLKKDGVKPADIVWAFKKEEDINLAYNLLIQSLQQLKSQTARTITERYGSMSKVRGFTEAEYRAWIQLLSLDDGFRNAEIAYKAAQEAKDRTKEKQQKKAMDSIKRQKERAIKMASGIAWGHSREAWGVLLDAKLLIKRDGKGTEDDPYTIAQHYGGSQSTGIEKMLAELHPATSDDRWGRDKVAPIWMLYQPRDLEAADTGWKRDEVFTHTRLYDLYDQHQKAFYAGRSDNLADFDDNYVTLHEFANVTSLHMLRREGWRLRQYELYMDKYAKEAEKEGLKGMDMHEYMMKRLMVRGGPRLVKMYIDKKVGDMLKVDGGADKSMSRRFEKGKKAEEGEKKIGKEFSWQKNALTEARKAKQYGLERYYAKYIFDDLSKRFTTSLIAFEQPRYMPMNERTLYTSLNSFIEKEPFLKDLPPNVIQTEVYPIYIDAIHTMERHRWEQVTKSKAGTEKEQIARQLADPTDLSAADFNDPGIKAKLKTHFKLNNERMGEITEKRHSLTKAKTDQEIDQAFEEYYESLKRFHTKLLEERDKDRYNRVGGRNKRRESLSKRYAHMLAIKQGGIDQALGGSYFDFSLEIQQGGVDAINRLSGDVVKSAEMTEAWNELAGDGGAIEKFAMSGASSEDEIKSGAKAIAEAIGKVSKVPYSFSPEQGNEYKIRHEIFWARAFEKPKVFRGLLGPLHEINWKSAGGGQSSLIAEYYQQVFGRTSVTALDADQLRTMLDEFEHVLKVPPRRFEVAEYEGVSDMNIARRGVRRLEDATRYVPLVGPLIRGTLRSFTSPLTEAHAKKYNIQHYNQDLALREMGARNRDVLKEKLISWQSFALLASIFLGYAKKADDVKSLGGGGGGGGGSKGHH